jgi:hypothetical protein
VDNEALMLNVYSLRILYGFLASLKKILSNSEQLNVRTSAHTQLLVNLIFVLSRRKYSLYVLFVSLYKILYLRN